MAYAPGDAAIAIPLEHIVARPLPKAKRAIARLVEERGAGEVIVGLPRHLGGAEGETARWVREFAAELATMLPNVRIALVDERRSTVTAKARLHERGIPEREQRAIIDSVAAQVVLEQALEMERVSGRPAGEEVVPAQGKDVDE